MTEDRSCPNCDGRLICGFIFDRGHMEVKQQQVWVEGEPERSFWSGLKTSGRALMHVMAYRWQGCGRLELYAADGVDT